MDCNPFLSALQARRDCASLDHIFTMPDLEVPQPMFRQADHRRSVFSRKIQTLKAHLFRFVLEGNVPAFRGIGKGHEVWCKSIVYAGVASFGKAEKQIVHNLSRHGIGGCRLKSRALLRSWVTKRWNQAMEPSTSSTGPSRVRSQMVH